VRFDAGTPRGVIFNFSNGSQAELQLERDGSLLVMFYDLGDPDEGEAVNGAGGCCPGRLVHRARGHAVATAGSLMYSGTA
jgi:hypothetical protein